MAPRRLSIIIPALDESTVLPRTLQPLQSLRACGHEVILIDGGSSDDTCAIAAPLVDQVLDAPRGRARQMNKGALAATGDVLVFLHADTCLPGECDGKILGALKGRSTGWGRFDVELSRSSWSLRVVAFAMNLRSRLSGIATGDQCIFVTRSLFERVGGFPDIPLMEDVAMSRALKRLTSPVCLRDRVVTSSRRWLARGVVRTVVTMWWLRLRYKLGDDPHQLQRIYNRS